MKKIMSVSRIENIRDWIDMFARFPNHRIIIIVTMQRHQIIQSKHHYENKKNYNCSHRPIEKFFLQKISSFNKKILTNILRRLINSFHKSKNVAISATLFFKFMVLTERLEPPTSSMWRRCSTNWAKWANKMVGLTELESVTSSMSTRHSNQLSYNPTSLKTLQSISLQLSFVKNFLKFI